MILFILDQLLKVLLTAFSVFTILDFLQPGLISNFVHPVVLFIMWLGVAIIALLV